MRKKRCRQLREIDFKSIDVNDEFDDIKDDVFSSGWDDAWADNKGRKGRERLAKRDRFADDFSFDGSDGEDEYRASDWEDDYRPSEWEDEHKSIDW